jgi:hypothetical protein
MRTSSRLIGSPPLGLAIIEQFVYDILPSRQAAITFANMSVFPICFF